jgi:hypothetical protein
MIFFDNLYHFNQFCKNISLVSIILWNDACVNKIIITNDINYISYLAITKNALNK